MNLYYNLSNNTNYAVIILLFDAGHEIADPVPSWTALRLSFEFIYNQIYNFEKI
jgi:hypothetical protein